MLEKLVNEEDFINAYEKLDFKSNRNPHITDIPTVEINGQYYNGLLSENELLAILEKHKYFNLE
ncbi:hypothetical protein AZF37_07140 [endosymbiont 'TC1' of Trimyema compressum]|uniref:hypothetical protein n=1 Tax=endosymbiont 'TC1' of Trimyema compressum TaxID=243899 RepID=UPI0007F10C5E|nr:hypothetical protein [endosymbiont 'TC1' of Trimyema compressum]AMP20965.1 hypothetical protein AZF37_07140 [endosymbiont 'TC1' of Trimyema compressum]